MRCYVSGSRTMRVEWIEEEVVRSQVCVGA